MSVLFTEKETKGIKGRYFRVGATYLVIGLLLLATPFISFISDESLIGAVFLAVGISIGWNAFTGFRDGDKPWQQTLMSVISLSSGLVFLFHPLSGVIVLSFFLATYLFVGGIMMIVEFFRIRTIVGAFWILLAGVVHVMSALILWRDFRVGPAVLGVMFGITLTLKGTAFILAAKNRHKPS